MEYAKIPTCDTYTAIGQLNQDELARRIDPFICIDPSREHLHNQFICAIYSNSLRDPPEPGVASWVSASDKLTTSSKPVTGDAAEQRLKTEVMQLPPRERHRLKQMQDVSPTHNQVLRDSESNTYEISRTTPIGLRNTPVNIKRREK
jgi:transcriptional coactivator HFI1/ADA1